MQRRLLWGIAGLVAALGVTAMFLGGLAMKEHDNRFCVACHLHEGKFERIVASTPTDLAGAHYRHTSHVGCIGCHGGADMPMRLRVWSVAGVDTLRFLVGAYGEPASMRLPLRNDDCRVCHTPIVRPLPPPPDSVAHPPAAAVSGPEAAYIQEPPVERQAPSFHGVREHDTIQQVACVRCHRAHDPLGAAGEHFLVQPVVQPVCRECHRRL